MDLRLRLFFKSVNSCGRRSNEETRDQVLKLISAFPLEKTLTSETLIELSRILFELLKKYFGGD